MIVYDSNKESCYKDNTLVDYIGISETDSEESRQLKAVDKKKKLSKENSKFLQSLGFKIKKKIGSK